MALMMDANCSVNQEVTKRKQAAWCWDQVCLDPLTFDCMEKATEVKNVMIKKREGQALQKVTKFYKDEYGTINTIS